MPRIVFSLAFSLIFSEALDFSELCEPFVIYDHSSLFAQISKAFSLAHLLISHHLCKNSVLGAKFDAIMTTQFKYIIYGKFDEVDKGDNYMTL